MTKIIELIPDLKRGGAAILLSRICPELKKKYKHIEIIILSYLYDNTLFPVFKDAGIEVVCLNLPEQGAYFKKLFQTFKILKKYKPDIIHSHSLPTDRYALIIAFLTGIKARISTAHNMADKPAAMDTISRHIASVFASKIIAVSNCAKKFYQHNRIYPENKLQVIYNCAGFISGPVKPRALPEPVKVIKVVTVSNIRAVKGLIYLIRAMHTIQNLAVRFTLELYGSIFENDYYTLLLNEIASLKLTNVFIKGDTGDVRGVLERADIFVTASLSEAMPLSVLEAMSVGLPIIATDIEPHREILSDVDNGIWAQKEDPESLGNAIKNIIFNPALYNDVSRQLLERSQAFSLSSTVDQHYDLYQSQILNRRQNQVL